MAVRSPIAIVPLHETSNPYSGSDLMSLDALSAPRSATSSSYATPEPGSIDETDTSAKTPALTAGDGEESREADQSEEKAIQTITPVSHGPGLKIQTSQKYQPNLSRSDEDEPPQSVIHAPPGFGEFSYPRHRSQDDDGDDGEVCDEEVSSSSSISDSVEPIRVPQSSSRVSNSPISPPLLTTSVTPVKDWDRATPRAQTRNEFDEIERRTHSSSLEDIPEGTFGNKEAEINALRAALAECWTLCNTLASLSYINRQRLFESYENTVQEDAWRSCWKLCQKLYDTRDDDYASQVNPTLDLCRDFCQALFEVRVSDNDLADSVLRVSFELNNHLYNTHDRNLPDAFRERTLDFYITLCHRLMKQRTRLTETDSLLSACWTLAEMLFSIRQSKREGKRLDEELLGSAVQACWELCDIFREGWTLHSMRNSDRGTPRPSQTTFAQAFQQATQQSELDFIDDASAQLGNPETPTTIFEDTATVSPDDAPVPNILVLGHGNGHTTHSKWPSSASSISEKSRSSGQTANSANTVTTVSEDPNFTRLKVLITRAAMNSGYQRGDTQNMSSFVKSLSSDSFGSAPWQTSLLKNYRKLVAYDPAFKTCGPQARVSAVEVSRACQAMLQSGQYPWLRDLYRLVFGFHMEEAMTRKGVIIQS